MAVCELFEAQWDKKEDKKPRKKKGPFQASTPSEKRLDYAEVTRYKLLKLENDD